MDEQYFRKCKEASIDFAAKKDESGEYRILERDRPSGRVKIIAEGLEETKARQLRNELISSSDIGQVEE